jgi:outer membrane beta-barrel protein
MEGRIRLFLLTALTLTLGGCSMWPFHRHAAAPTEVADSTPEDSAPPTVVDPTVVRRKVSAPKIKSSNFEIGGYAGTYSAEDFGVNPVYGGRLTYHISEDVFAEALLGRTTTGRTSYEVLSGGANLLTQSQRVLTYYDLAFGYDLLPGEIYSGHHALNSALYITGGVGATHFAGADHFGVMVGTGYRLLLNNWVAAHLDVRDHIFDSNLLGYTKTSHNLETSLGITVFF